LILPWSDFREDFLVEII